MPVELMVQLGKYAEEGEVEVRWRGGGDANYTNPGLRGDLAGRAVMRKDMCIE